MRKDRPVFGREPILIPHYDSEEDHLYAIVKDRTLAIEAAIKVWYDRFENNPDAASYRMISIPVLVSADIHQAENELQRHKKLLAYLDKKRQAVSPSGGNKK